MANVFVGQVFNLSYEGCGTAWNSVDTMERNQTTPRDSSETSLSLIARLRAREGEAWHAFAELYAPLVVRWCHRQGQSDADNADVAQEVFRIVSEAVGQFRKEGPEDSFRGWLCRITHREIAAFHRKRAGMAQARGGSDFQERLENLPDPRRAELDADEIRAETRYLFQQAMRVARSEFSDTAWQIFWRVAVDGNSAPSVAEEFRTTPAAVRQTKARVLRRLKQVVGDVAD